MTGYVEYDSNNSGGDWWLSDEDWRALEAAGWRVHWAWLVKDGLDDDGLPFLRPYDEARDYEYGARCKKRGERWLGALATGAYRRADTLEEAVEEWIEITGQDPDEEGCPCCGEPHYFRFVSDRRADQ